MIRWSFSWAVRKKVLIGQTDRSGVMEYDFMECVDWVLGGLGGRKGAQWCLKHGCWLMHMEMPALKGEICCWM